MSAEELHAPAGAFLAWHRDAMSPSEAVRVDARNVEDAAIAYAQRDLGHGHCTTELVVCVVDDEGVVAEVRVDAAVTFQARVVGARRAA